MHNETALRFSSSVLFIMSRNGHSHTLSKRERVWYFMHNTYFSLPETIKQPLQDQSVFINETATFTSCKGSNNNPGYTINGESKNMLEANFQSHVVFTTAENSGTYCHELQFPAWLDYDNAVIEFIFTNGERESATLRIQGVY